MHQLRITKYNPKYRNKKGHYKRNEWTDIYEVGNHFEGVKFTKESYIKTENEYINAVVEILKENDLKHLRLIGFQENRYKYSLQIFKNKWFHETAYEQLNLFEDKLIPIEIMPLVIQLHLRGYIDSNLAIYKQFFVHFGYDYYMYVGAIRIPFELKEHLRSPSLFIEDIISPYHADYFKYKINIFDKRSDLIEDSLELFNFTSEQVKSIFNFSEEHTGYIHQKINPKIAIKLNLNLDFEQFEYYINCEAVKYPAINN